MKRLFFVLLATVVAFPLWADTPKKWNFTLNDDGDCVINVSYPTSKTAAEAMKAVKVTINKQKLESRQIINEVEGRELVIDIKRNTKTRYNPFAGNFNESMQLRIVVTASDGLVSLEMKNFVLEHIYSGYGQNQSSDTFVSKIAEYEEALSLAKSGKGKEKKEALNTIEDINDSLNLCQEELDKILKQIESAL